ncbi:MAG TPA: 30S ribosomal protein S15 [Candidatus Nanoarchaeia archaeon]|nr:30S ribosomal protein S15 [Candidatus Nanoarchaeia archaeon]
MARMYSRRKGKSKSTRPLKKGKPGWLRYQKEEVEQLIVKMAKAGKRKSEIGMILRDSYGIPDAKIVIEKKIGGFLEEQKISEKLPDDLVNLIKRDIVLMKHIGKQKDDQTAKRGLLITGSKIHRLVKYYKANKRLPGNWKYDREQAQLLVS